MNNKSFDHSGIFTVACLIIIIALSDSCKKQNQSTAESNTICVTRLYPTASDYRVAGSELDSIYALFSANNLSTANLQFLSWSTDTTTNIYSSQYSGYQEQVLAMRFINGLPVFADDEFFTFDAGKFQPGGIYDGYTGPAPAQDSNSTGLLTLADLRNAFLAHVPESFTEGGASNAKPFVPSASTYVNSCLTVTFGYLDAGLIPGNATTVNQALVKVWRVTPTINSSITYYPLIYLEDDNGHAWGVPFIVP